MVEIRLYQNGKLISDDTRQLVQAAANSKNFNVTLVPGTNTFYATAFNKERTESKPVEVKIVLRAAESWEYDLALVQVLRAKRI